MKKFLAVAAAGVLAVGVSLAATAPSQAFFPGGAFVVGMAGFMAGAVVASAAEHDHWSEDNESWSDHVEACKAEFGWHYSSHTDLVHLHGHVFECEA